MTIIVRASEYVDVPRHLEGRIELVKREPKYASVEASYEVLLRSPRVPGAEAVTIGYVTKHRTESWRKSGRIRTSLIGRPIHWEAERTPDWRQAGTHAMDYRIGYHHTRRNTAAVALAEAYLTGVKP